MSVIFFIFCFLIIFFFFFQAEDGIRDRSPSRGLGDVYKRQGILLVKCAAPMRSRALIAASRAASAVNPLLRGPNITSSKTVGAKTWLSESWNTKPTSVMTPVF